MKQGVSQWLLGLILVAFPIGCLILTFALIHNPPQTMAEDEELDSASELTPPDKVTQLPDFSSIEHIPDRKEAFYELLMPMIEWRNHQLSAMRETVLQMQEQLDLGENLSTEQQRRLEKLRVHFRVSEDNYSSAEEALEVLKIRVDVVPSAMVLAQGAAESGWGTSRFAVEGNNIFGQWCYRKGCGLVPGSRSEDMSHEVQIFETVNEAVATYFRNINTNRAYRELRQLRSELRAQDQPLTGTALVEGLQRYSSRGQAYIEELRELIRFNDLEDVEERLAQKASQAESEDSTESSTQEGEG